MNGPMLIRNGLPISISQADYDQMRRSQVVAVTRTSPPPIASAPIAAPRQESEQVKRKARAFDAMMADQGGRETSQQSMVAQLKRMGVDPKARAAPAPSANKTKPDPTLSGRDLARASMDKLIRSRGEEPVKR